MITISHHPCLFCGNACAKILRTGHSYCILPPGKLLAIVDADDPCVQHHMLWGKEAPSIIGYFVSRS